MMLRFAADLRFATLPRLTVRVVAGLRFAADLRFATLRSRWCALPQSCGLRPIFDLLLSKAPANLASMGCGLRPIFDLLLYRPDDGAERERCGLRPIFDLLLLHQGGRRRRVAAVCGRSSICYSIPHVDIPHYPAAVCGRSSICYSLVRTTHCESNGFPVRQSKKFELCRLGCRWFSLFSPEGSNF